MYAASLPKAECKEEEEKENQNREWAKEEMIKWATRGNWKGDTKD